MSKIPEDTKVFHCHSSDFHPYECDYDTCIHCAGVVSDRHNPKSCALCKQP